MFPSDAPSTPVATIIAAAMNASLMESSVHKNTEEGADSQG
jgi:hypothetical protein